MHNLIIDCWTYIHATWTNAPTETISVQFPSHASHASARPMKSKFFDHFDRRSTDALTIQVHGVLISWKSFCRYELRFLLPFRSPRLQNSAPLREHLRSTGSLASYDVDMTGEVVPSPMGCSSVMHLLQQPFAAIGRPAFYYKELRNSPAYASILSRYNCRHKRKGLHWGQSHGLK